MHASIHLEGEKELRELQAAARQRVDALEKAAKKADDEYRPDEAEITRNRLALWRGDSYCPGILSRIADQMSLYEPAFSDDGKEPDGQQSMFDGEEKPEEEQARVPLGALKAALILSELTGRVADSAFDPLDPLPEDDAPERYAYLGRATIETLAKLETVDALELFVMATELPADEGGEERPDHVLEEDERLCDQLATMIASDGGARAPYHSPFPVAAEATHYTPGLDLAENLTEEDFAALTIEQLAELVQAAIHQPTPEQEAAEAKEEATVERQVHVLVHAPATGDEFKFAVEHASAEACTEALTIVSGLEGNATREKALRKRLSLLEGEPGAEYDLNDARTEALRVLALATDPIPAGNATDAEAGTVHWAAASYLQANGLASDGGVGKWELTARGLKLAAEMGLMNEPTAELEGGELVMQGSELTGALL